MGKSTTAAPARTRGSGTGAAAIRGRKRYSVLTGVDKWQLIVMVGVPVALDLILIWGPTVASIFISLTDWNGFGAITAQNFIGLRNYQVLFTQYLFFWPAVWHNLIWLAFFGLIATPLGMFLAVLLDREIRGTRVYQSIFFMPVVLSFAIIGFIWQLIYSPTQGLINNVFENPAHGNVTDWLGNPKINLWATLVAVGWRHVGYIMVLYLAGLKSVDPALREAAAIDGASERQIFFRIVFPVLAPINLIILVVTAIESLRAFDIVYIINHGKNGLELLSTLITNNSISEASLVGFGSAIAVVLLVISIVPIVIYLSRVMRPGAS